MYQSLYGAPVTDPPPLPAKSRGDINSVATDAGSSGSTYLHTLSRAGLADADFGRQQTETRRNTSAILRITITTINIHGVRQTSRLQLSISRRGVSGRTAFGADTIAIALGPCGTVVMHLRHVVIACREMA